VDVRAHARYLGTIRESCPSVYIVHFRVSSLATCRTILPAGRGVGRFPQRAKAKALKRGLGAHAMRL